VTGVEAPAVRHHLLELAGEREVGKELGGVRMRREARDRGGRHNQGHTLLRIDDLDRVPFLLHLIVVVVIVVVAPIHHDRSLARRHHAHRVDRRLDEHELVLRELFEVVPPV
jgi:hypothetical protein